MLQNVFENVTNNGPGAVLQSLSIKKLQQGTIKCSTRLPELPPESILQLRANLVVFFKSGNYEVPETFPSNFQPQEILDPENRGETL